MELGGYRIDPVIDGQGLVPAGDMFPDVASERWTPHRSMLVDDSLTIAVGGLLVRGHGRIALVDLGYGPGALGRIPTGQMLGALHALGVEPRDVTDVLFTHLHRDHVGWASVDGVTQFPSATFRWSAVDHRYFVEERHGDPEIATRVRGASNRIETFDESATPLPGVEVLHAPGHTPGSTVFVFASAGVRSVVLGDVVHSPVQLIEDEWNTPFDVDPQLARTTRKQLLRDLEDDPDVLLTAMHFPDMRFGRLVLVDGRRRWIV